MSRRPTSLHRAAWLAATLAAAAAPALAAEQSAPLSRAGEQVASLAFAGGEALPPEAEARLTALTTAPGGLYSREDVRQQLAAARDEGTLAEAGELAEPPRVLLARRDANERQTQAILAAHEAAERARLAAIEAEAQRQAQLQAQAQAAQLAQAGTGETAEGRETLEPPVPGAPVAAEPQPMAAADGLTEPPTDEPAQLPIDRPALAPIELPITRPSDLPAEVLVDKD